MLKESIAKDVTFWVEAHEDFERTAKAVLCSYDSLAELVAAVVADVIDGEGGRLPWLRHLYVLAAHDSLDACCEIVSVDFLYLRSSDSVDRCEHTCCNDGDDSEHHQHVC